MAEKRLFAAISGGGTAGHVNPALAIAEALVELGHPRSRIAFVGSRRGMEASLVPSAGFGFTGLPGRGMNRSVRLSSLLAVLEGALAGLLAVAWILRHRPRVVVSVGGYAALPLGLAARLTRTPLVVAESNAVAGLANRVLGRFAAACAVAFEGTGLPRAQVTGNPVRVAIAAVAGDSQARLQARARLGIDEDRFTVLVTGGSLGARRINTAALEMCSRLRGRHDVAVRHVFGRRDWPGKEAAHRAVFTPHEELEEVASQQVLKGKGSARKEGAVKGLLYQPVCYEDAMPDALAAADLVISRSGATTVAELCAAARASVLIPLPNAPGDHQTANAQALERAGAAVVLEDGECSGERLAAIVDELASDPRRCIEMGEAAGRLARPDAARAIALLAESCARR